VAAIGAAGFGLRGLGWLVFGIIERPTGQTAYAAAALAGVTLLVGAIAARSLVAAGRGQFLPGPAAAPPALPAAARIPGAEEARDTARDRVSAASYTTS
jgi:hypothetical protein